MILCTLDNTIHEVELLSNYIFVFSFKTLDKIGRISKINERGDIEVIFENEADDEEQLRQTFLYHPAALIFICRQDELESQPLQYPKRDGMFLSQNHSL